MEQIPRDTKCFPRVSKMAIITNNLYQLVLFPTVDHKTIIIQKFHLFFIYFKKFWNFIDLYYLVFCSSFLLYDTCKYIFLIN
jgi:hypothetical protein